MYEITQDRGINSSLYLPVSPHFPGIPTRIVGEVTFNTKRQRYELVDRQGTEINQSYVRYHENQIKCYFFLTLVN